MKTAKMRGRFHVLKIDGVSEERQGLIFFICRNFRALSPEKRAILDELYAHVGGVNEAALRAVMETDDSFVKICREHYIASETTLVRLRVKFFQEFPLDEMIS